MNTEKCFQSNKIKQVWVIKIFIQFLFPNWKISSITKEPSFTNRSFHPHVFRGQLQTLLPVISRPVDGEVFVSKKHGTERLLYFWQHAYLITYLTALVVRASWEVPLLIAPFIWLSGCGGGPAPPPPTATTGLTEPLSWTFWLDKPRITGFSVRAVLISMSFVSIAMESFTVFKWSLLQPLQNKRLPFTLETLRVIQILNCSNRITAGSTTLQFCGHQTSK